MEIKFNTKDEYADCNCELTLEVLNNSLWIKNKTHWIVENEYDNSAFKVEDLSQLSDIIGALLHIQSKLNKNGKR